MGLFKSKQEKEFEKKMAVKKTVNELQKQIDKLTDAEKSYFELAKKAKMSSLDSQYTLAISGLRSTIAQKKRVQEMLLNFQIMVQAKDVAVMTTEFLKGMKSLSKDMVKLCNEKEFQEVAKSFDKASQASEMQEERMQSFLDNTKDSFESISKTQAGENADDLDALVDAELSAETPESGDIDEQIKALEKKIAEASK